MLDKHSTGGVGDNVSLMLAPAVAACGGFVPMISGRGLGHTGGTLDKLDSIPGYQTQPDIALFRTVVKQTGAAIIGQTSDLAPADKTIYAIRDVTATVESIPLITASILSKKLAAGLHGLVMDVKTGGGAFMPTLEGARELAASIAGVATGAGLPTTALITAMDQPLAAAAGNALEVRSAVDFLTGDSVDGSLFAVTCELGAEMLVLGGLAMSVAEGRARMAHAFESGAAAERFARMVAALGGPADFLERPADHLPQPEVVVAAVPSRPGLVAAIDARALGVAVVALGGGRTRPQDRIDHAVGFTGLARLGDAVGPEHPLAIIHARDAAAGERAAAAVRAAYHVGERATASAARARTHHRLRRTRQWPARSFSSSIRSASARRPMPPPMATPAPIRSAISPRPAPRAAATAHGLRSGAAAASQSRPARDRRGGTRLDGPGSAGTGGRRRSRRLGLCGRALARQGHPVRPLGDCRLPGRFRLGLFSPHRAVLSRRTSSPPSSRRRICPVSWPTARVRNRNH